MPYSTFDYCRDVLPSQGRYAIFLGADKHHAWFDTREDAAAQIERLSVAGIRDVYAALAAFDGTRQRKADNAVALRAFYFDIDAGADKYAKHGDKVYPTQREALQALQAWTEGSGIKPSLIVLSGTGVHVYFRLDEDYPVAAWRPVAVALKRMALSQGLRIDPAVTSDAARVLRPVGTMHRSGEAVRAIVRSDQVYSLERMQGLTMAFAERPRRESRINDDVLAPVVGPPKTIHKIVERCAAMNHVAAARGDVPEPLWRLALGAAKHTIEGLDAAHALSSGHPDYDSGETEKKYDAWRVGPPTCARFEDELQQACAACQYRGKVTSPVQLGALPTGATGADTAQPAPSARLQGARVPAAVGESRAPASNDARTAAVLTRAADITVSAVQWILHGWLAAGAVAVLASPPGVGKTTICMAVTATVSRGERWFDGTRCMAGNVVIWSGEDDPNTTLVPRLMACGADLSRVFFVEGVRSPDGSMRGFDPASDMARVVQQCDAIGEVRLLILDPVVSAVAGDSHHNAEVRRGLQPVVDLARRVGCAVLGVTHFGKGTAGRDPLERVLGSAAFGAVARVVWSAAKVRGDDPNARVLVRTKSNLGPDDGGVSFALGQIEVAPGVFASRVTWGAPIPGSPRDILAAAEGPGAGSRGGTEAETFLRDLLDSGEMNAKDVKDAAGAAGWTWGQIRGASAKLGVIVRKAGLRGGWKWSLPHTPSAEDADEGGATPTCIFEDAEPAPSKAQCSERGLLLAPSEPVPVGAAWGSADGGRDAA